MSSILVADDDDDLREALADALLEKGYPVRTARDGAEAMTILRSDPPPAVIVLDLVMGRVGGREVLEALREGHGGLKRVPVIVITGFDVSARDLDALDVDDVLVKPFPMESLFTAVEQAAARAVGGEEAIPPAKACFLCGTPRSPNARHNISAEIAKSLRRRRCLICGKSARVRCLLGPDDSWVECPDGHLTHAISAEGDDG